MGDTDKVTILNRAGPGSTPQEPLAFVAMIPESALEPGGRSGLEGAAEPDTTSDSVIRYRTSIQNSHTFLFVLTSRLLGEVYYLLYTDDYEMLSKVAFDPVEPFLGRIRADSVAPPHSPVTITRCISRVENTPALADADLFAKLSCDSPLKRLGHISILRADCPGLSPKEPMAIVLDPVKHHRTPAYTANVTTTLTFTHTLTGLDFVRQLNKTDSSPLDTLRVAVSETSEVVATPIYGKRPSYRFNFFLQLLICVNFVSILPDLCRGWSYSLKDGRCSG